MDAVGIISSSAITTDDLRAGLYREAKITVMLVDHRFPWLGYIARAVFWISTINFDGEKWQTETIGLMGWAQRSAGSVFTRDCQHVFGDSGCGINKELAAHKFTGTVSSVTDRRTISTSISGKADDFFAFGLLVVTSGDNNGLEFDVQDFTGTGGIFKLRIYAPHDFGVGDAFTAYRGCDHTAATCEDTFDNLLNFGGFHMIPGPDNVYRIAGQ
jgi:uncharacterized phage protein (TIGR02218 family)